MRFNATKGKMGTEMKKIISLLLAIICVFTLFSCGDESPIDGFTKIVSSSEPTKIITLTSYNDGDNLLTGSYETQFYGADFMMVYNYQSYAVPAPDANPDEFIANYEGKIYYHEGLYSVDEGATWTTGTPNESAMQVKFDLGAVELKDFTISKDKKTLTATVSAEEAEKILGVKVASTEDGVKIEVVHDGKNLRQIRVSYSTENATLVSLETSYSYSEVTSPFANGDAAGE